MRRYGGEPDVPPVSFGSALIGWLWQVGPMDASGAAISWQELSAWAGQTGRRLSRWESETLREMSQAYAVMARQARDPVCIAPWQPIKASSDVIARQIRDVLGLTGKRKTPKPDQSRVVTRRPGRRQSKRRR